MGVYKGCHGAPSNRTEPEMLIDIPQSKVFPSICKTDPIWNFCCFCSILVQFCGNFLNEYNFGQIYYRDRSAELVVSATSPFNQKHHRETTIATSEQQYCTTAWQEHPPLSLTGKTRDQQAPVRLEVCIAHNLPRLSLRKTKTTSKTMGTIFGKQSVAEPAFDVILSKTTGSLPYEIRRYGTRFAAQVEYRANASDKDDGTPFGLLARYIGVFGTPENKGETSISMTAPVIKQQQEQGGTPIAMTAPVIKKTSSDANTTGDERIMQFILPDQYTSLEQIPQPTNMAVTIQTIPPAMGAVHRYTGSFEDDRALAMAQSLAGQLQADGVALGESWVSQHYQFWGFNPPFTLPPFRRNEVWLPLTPEQVERLTQGFQTESAI